MKDRVREKEQERREKGWKKDRGLNEKEIEPDRKRDRKSWRGKVAIGFSYTIQQ